MCDVERRIVYWSKSAERITGWRAEEVVGRRCLDDILSPSPERDLGLAAILRQLGCPQESIRGAHLEDALLTFSNNIRLDDDLTLLEFRFR